MSKKTGGVNYWAILNLIMGVAGLIGVFLPYVTFLIFFSFNGLTLVQFASLYGGSLLNVPYSFVLVILAGAILAVIFSAIAVLPSMAGKVKILSVLVVVTGVLVLGGSLLIYLPLAQVLVSIPSILASIGIGLYLDLISGALLFIFGIVMLLKGP